MPTARQQIAVAVVRQGKARLFGGPAYVVGVFPRISVICHFTTVIQYVKLTVDTIMGSPTILEQYHQGKQRWEHGKDSHDL
jgi:hypothetical protein